MFKINLNVWLLFSFVSCMAAPTQASVVEIFSERNQTQQLLDIEAALARAQAQLDIIPQWAATELTLKANNKYVSDQALQQEFTIVRHRMVALLNVWKRAIEHGAEQYMHFGATTVDIYDTLLVLQVKASISELIKSLRNNEMLMMTLAKEHANTLMIGRTLGQHALPITFGKKVSTWLGENRRNIERLKRVYFTLNRSGILKGAVGSYLGLGDNGIELEAKFSAELGLSGQPYLSDWHGARDVFAEYSYVLALISRSYGRIGQELFLLQTTDIGETVEVRSKTAVGSSTMPHKQNPSKSESLIHYARTIPRLSEVISDDMVNFFERDNTSRTNRVVAEISIESEKMLKTAGKLLSSLQVNKGQMRKNVDKTNGLVMSQRLVFALADRLGKTKANDVVHHMATSAMETQLTLRKVFEQSSGYSHLLSVEQLDKIFEPSSYVGLAEQQTLSVIEYCKQQRMLDDNVFK